jgi:hypothetical protein
MLHGLVDYAETMQDLFLLSIPYQDMEEMMLEVSPLNHASMLLLVEIKIL